MINFEQIQNYFPPQIRENPAHKKYIVKEYIQLMILNFLATTKFVQKNHLYRRNKLAFSKRN
jgi:hypothetical protein